MIDIQATTKSKYYDHIVLLYLEYRICRYRSIIFACFYLYGTVVNFKDYSDMDKMIGINNDKC
jgi:ABC-type polysaccharide transport system permease subunit